MPALVQINQQLQAYPTIATNYIRTGFTFAAIGTTALVTLAPQGIYRFSVYLVITTAQGSQTVTINALFTDDQQAETIAVLNAVSTTAQGQFNGSAIIENTSTANNISFSLATTATTAVGNFYIVVERLF